MSGFSRIVSGTAALVAAVAIAAVPLPFANATANCTAWGALPARVALHTDKTVVKIVLRGTSGCRNRRTDNGASASLVYPAGSREDQRWRHFGDTQAVTLYVNIVKSGRFELRRGNVQLYDDRYERVPWSWRATSMVVKRGARIVHVSAQDGVVAGRALVYTKYGWAGYSAVPVYVQRRAVNAAGWHTLGSVRPGRNGRVAYRTATSARYVYRMITHATATAWNAASVSVRGSMGY
jgi:hypothetical protein